MMETHTTYRVAAVQAEPAWLDLPGSLDKTESLIEEAARAGAALIAFPEVWLPGYPHFLWLGSVAGQGEFVRRYHAASITVDGPEMLRLRAAARRNAIVVALGFSEKAGGSLYISQVIIDSDGQVLLHRRKLKPTHVERSLFGEGDGSDLQVIDTRLGRIGALNCAEHLQPLTKYAMYAQDEQVHIAAWPCFGLYRDVAHLLSAEVNMAASQVYAAEGGCFCVVATQVISAAGVAVFARTEEQAALLTVGGGASRVYGPDARQLTEDLDETAEGLVIADIDLDIIALAKSAFDPAGHYSRADALQLVHDRRPRRPVIVVGPGTEQAEPVDAATDDRSGPSDPSRH